MGVISTHSDKPRICSPELLHNVDAVVSEPSDNWRNLIAPFSLSCPNDRWQTGRSYGRVPKKSRCTPPLTVLQVIRFNLEPGPRRTEKRVLGRIDHNRRMAFPDCQISGLGMRNLTEGVNPLIEFPRVSISVRKASFFVDVVNDMGAVVPRLPSIADLQRSPDDRHAFIQADETR